MTGYDLNAVIEISTQYFWSMSQSQIYRNLNIIEAEGWVSAEVFLQEDRPPCKVYKITASGEVELQRWLSTFHEPNPPRIPWLIRVFFAGQIKDEDILSVLKEKRVDLQRQLSRIQAACVVSAGEFTPDQNPRDVFYWMLTVDYGEMKLTSQIDWIDRVIDKIRNREYTSPEFIVRMGLK